MTLDRDIVEHGAPTLAGLKTGNLFPVRTETEDIGPELRRINRLLAGKGVRLIPLRRTRKNTLVYLYRPDRLERDLSCGEAEELLAQKGYPCGNPNKCIVELIRHLGKDEDFPHEIGLFLGYPPSDVKCFMKDPYNGVKCTGCWKAYGHEKEAEATFDKFRKCTDVYRRVFQTGRPLERLTVGMR